MVVEGLATAAIAIFAPYLAKAGAAAAQKAGEMVPEKVGALLQAIRRKFTTDQDADAEQSLKSLEAKPDSQPRQAALAEVLAEKAQADPQFARELEELVQDARTDPQVGQFLTQVYGNARVENLLNIGTVTTETFTVGGIRREPDDTAKPG